MEPEIVEKWKARIVAREISILPPSVQSGAQFLLRARNDDGSWGAYPGMPLDLASSAAAIEALEACEQADFEPTIRSSRIALQNYIRERVDSLDLSARCASLHILARADRNADLCELAGSLINGIRESRNGSAWGSPIPAIPTTADVLLALIPYRDIAGDLIDSTVRVLLDEQNQDGGWPVTIGRSDSTPVSSARAICALVAAQPEQESNDFRDASRYLQGLLGRGWLPVLSGPGGVQVAAQALRAAAMLKSFPFDMVSQGVELILDQRNSDEAWGERKGGNSNVEATSACLVALCAAGANRLITSKFALSAITDAGIALAEARRELDQMRGDVRNQVTRGARSIVAENDRLNARVIELEKEKKILVSKVEENELTIRTALEQASDRLDSRRGSESLSRSVGLLVDLFHFISELEPVLAWAGVAILLTLGLRFLGNKLGFNAEVINYLIYGVLVVAGVAIAYVLVRAFITVWGRSASFKKIGGLELKVGDIGASDRKLVQRRLATYVTEWPAGTRESFLHQLSRLLGLLPETREAAARSIAREFAAQGQRPPEDLSILLTLFASLPERDQTDILYSLREVPGRVTAS